jgi:NAD-dependent SIR2 family protein deacetylase
MGRSLSPQRLQCKDCGETFTFSVGEQEWYKKMDFDVPKRCPVCRRRRKKEREKNDKRGFDFRPV